MSHWARQYLGTPWESGAVGPDAYDCWGLVRVILRQRYDIEVPMVPDADTESILQVASSMLATTRRDYWQQEKTPHEGDVVTLGKARYPSHCGIWIDADGGGVLHCERGSGVCFSKIDDLRLFGWGLIEYYRYKIKG